MDLKKQYTIIIEQVDVRRNVTTSFKNFLEKSEVLAYVSNMSKGRDKVRKIICITDKADIREMDIVFYEGMLHLTYKGEGLN